MAQSFGSAKGRTLAETVEAATRHLADKAMPQGKVATPGRRYSPKPRPVAEAASEPAKDSAQD
jgi:hypothetical protein